MENKQRFVKIKNYFENKGWQTNEQRTLKRHYHITQSSIWYTYISEDVLLEYLNDPSSLNKTFQLCEPYGNDIVLQTELLLRVQKERKLRINPRKSEKAF